MRCYVIGLGAEFEDPYGDFASLCLPDETGVILVRPDQVVAWRAGSMPKDPGTALSEALKRILDR